VKNKEVYKYASEKDADKKGGNTVSERKKRKAKSVRKITTRG
jgi:hypothetical protein